MYVLNNSCIWADCLRLGSSAVIGWKIRNILSDKFLTWISSMNFALKDFLSGWALIISFQILTLCIPSPWFFKISIFSCKKGRFSYILQDFLFGIGIWILVVEHLGPSHHASRVRRNIQLKKAKNIQCTYGIDQIWPVGNF